MRNLILLAVPDSNKLTNSDHVLALYEQLTNRDRRHVQLGWSNGNKTLLIVSPDYFDAKNTSDVARHAKEVLFQTDTGVVKWEPSENVAATTDHLAAHNFNRATLKKYIKQHGSNLVFIGFQLTH